MPLISKSHRDVPAYSSRSVNENDIRSTAAPFLTRLEAHAAVRLDPLLGKTFDCYGLPLRRSGKDQRGHFSFIKSVRGLASYLTTSINPSFQECLICIIETESDMRLEVRQISNGKGSRARILFSASLSTLVDVTRDSVIEKDTVVFSQLPSGFQRSEENNKSSGSNPAAVSSGAAADTPHSGTTRCPHHQWRNHNDEHQRRHHYHGNGVASKKEELISTLFSAYGDIGLNLVFRATRTEEDRLMHPLHKHRHHTSSISHGGASVSNTARPYTRIGLRFVSTAERNEWLSFCSEVYMGLLLDSIRTNRDTVYVPDDNGNRSFANGAAAAAASSNSADSVDLEKPSEEAVENYIDFFLSARTKTEGNNHHRNGSRTDADPLPVPFGGTLRIRSTDGTLHTRQVSVEEEVDTSDAGSPVMRAYLVFRRKRWPGKYESQRIPLEELQVYADDDKRGTSFFLDFVFPGTSSAEHLASPSHSGRTATTNQLCALGAVQQLFLSGTELVGAQDTVTLECEAGSFAARRQWLQWLEVMLKKQVLYLSVARRSAEAQKSVEQVMHNSLLGDRVVW